MFSTLLELARAVYLLKEISTKAESKHGSLDDSMIEVLQRTSDAVSSSLFAKLIDIQNILQKVS